MTPSRLRNKLKNDAAFLKYVARRFLVTGSLDEVAVKLGMECDIFDQTFSEFEDAEDIFNAKVQEISDTMISNVSHSAANIAIARLIKQTNDGDKDVAAACKALLGFYDRRFPTVRGKTEDEDDEIDRLYRALKIGGK